MDLRVIYQKVMMGQPCLKSHQGLHVMEIILKTTAKERNLENGPYIKRVKRFNDLLKNIRNRPNTALKEFHMLRRKNYHMKNF